MGTLRFALALAVLLSHVGLTVQGLNPGVLSVIVFYAISGYVMSALIARHYASAARTPHFYLDRLSRLYPQYALYATGAALWFYSVGHTTPFLQQAAQPTDWLNNLLIVPLNFYMFNGADRFTLVPPAWSLGAELLFYALAPWLWRHWSLAIALALGSLGVQAMAWHGLIQTDWWGYRLLPGILWVFVLGMALQRLQTPRPQRARQIALATPLLVAAVWGYLSFKGLLAQPYHREVLLGLALGIPLLHWLSQAQGSVLRQRIDQQLGDLSYGIFLNHFLIMWLFGLSAPQHAWQWAALMVASIVFSALSQRLIERPVLLWRRKWRTLPIHKATQTP